MVSIIIPIYNAEKCIERCIESCIEQTYSNIAVIIINDGSTDITQQLLEAYSLNDPRIHYHNQIDHGVTAVRNVELSKLPVNAF